MEKEILDAFSPWVADFVNLAEMQDRPQLAHYTSLEAIEKIVKSKELWFSNPLFMNDLQEIRFGLTEGHRIFFEEVGHESFVNAVGMARINAFQHAFLHYYREFDEEQALKLYVFCLSEHSPDDNDGLLSMWRGYGSNGGGAALVFDTSFITARESSPIIIGKVNYSSDDDRREWIRRLVRFTKTLIIERDIPEDIIYVAAFQLFAFLKLNAALSKHKGFREEREWRIVYFPDRDVNHMFADSFTYVVGKTGIEPKLKFPIRPLPFEEPEAWTFDSILDRIILGPSVSSVLSANAVKGMFVALGMPTFAHKVVPSSIPFRLT